MRATLRKLLITLPIGLLFSVACWGQTTTAMQGEVKGEDGKPLKDALIKLERQDIKGTYKVKTDKKGHWYYGGLPIGKYRVVLEVDGKERDFVDNIQTRLGDPLEIGPFDLSARKQVAAAVAAGAPIPKEQAKGMTAEQKAEYEKKLKEQQQEMAKNKELNDNFNAGVEAQNASPPNWEVAIDKFEAASKLGPTQNVVWGRLADCYVALAKTKTGPDRDAALDKGVAAYQKAIELKPEAPEYHNNYAIALANQKKIAESQAELTKAAQLDPTQAGKYYYNLGAVLTNTGQNDAASDAFKKAIEADPNYADAYLQYGITLMGKATVAADGKMVPVPGTSEAFQKYLELRPDGKDAETAKAMLQSLGMTVETQFAKPGAKKTTPKKNQ